MNTSLEIALFWTTYYLILLSLCLLALVDKSQVDIYPWLEIKTNIDIIIDDKKINSVSKYLSESGAKISFVNDYSLPTIKKNQKIRIRINELNLQFNAVIQTVSFKDNQVYLQLEYSSLELEEYRQLIKYLFCQPNRWQIKKVPSEFSAFKILVTTLIIRAKQIIFGKGKNYSIAVLNLKKSSIKLLK